ncbi:MAG TPA: aminopeptidase P family N-terminal domain-containing protein, partial [Spirochaetia bacterium]|nr:aminopeptidase P family N-terminal domain-containing protein [Spirochaetia bacterium]
MPQPEAREHLLRQRQARFSAWLADSGISACVLDDFESLRANSLRWLSGHPMDAILFVFASGRTVLVPWDLNLAREMSVVDEVIPYTDFKRSFREAVIAVLARDGEGFSGTRKIEFAGHTTWLRHQELVQDLPGVEILVRQDGCDAYLGGLRAVKDDQEISALRKAARITDEIATMAEELMSRAPASGLAEIEMALFLEREAFLRGAEGMGFDTLAAGP